MVDWKEKAEPYRQSLKGWADAYASSPNPAVQNAVAKVREVLCVEDDEHFLAEARVAFNIFLTNTNPFAEERTPLDELHSIVYDISRDLGW